MLRLSKYGGGALALRQAQGEVLVGRLGETGMTNRAL